jgi:hypothetical protein
MQRSEILKSLNGEIVLDPSVFYHFHGSAEFVRVSVLFSVPRNIFELEGAEFDCTNDKAKEAFMRKFPVQAQARWEFFLLVTKIRQCTILLVIENIRINKKADACSVEFRALIF